MGESPEKMYALATVLTVLATVGVALRFYARRVKKVRLSWDDYLIVLALISTVGTGICMFVGAAIGSLGRHTPIAPDGMPVFNNRYEVLLKIIFITQLTQTVTFGVTKLAVVILYRRIFLTRTFSIISWIIIALTISWTVAFFAANLLQCLPIYETWLLSPAPGACFNTTMMYLAQAWSDVFTDIVILSLPLPWVWKLQMPPVRKVSVIIMFQLGGLVVCAGVAKLVIFHRILADASIGDEDITYALTPTVYWPMVESSLGIVGACLPLLRPIFTDTPAKNAFSSLRAMISRSSLRTNSAKTESLDYARLEAGSVLATQRLKVEVAQMV